MSMIVLIYGASGSGKSTLMEQLLIAGNRYSIHIKGIERPPREYDGVEIKCVSAVTPDKYDYIYQTYGYAYGIQRSQIDQAISQNQYHFIICNDIPTIRAIKRDYEVYVRVVFHYFDAPREELEKIQTARNISDDEIELRLAKIEVLYRTYMEEWELFDAVLFNHFGEPLARLRERMEFLLQRLREKKPSEDVYERISNRVFSEIEQLLINRKQSSAKLLEPGYVFVMMAMNSDPFLEDVHELIKDTCQDLRLRAERIDDMNFTGQITEKVLGSIQVAQLVIADLTYERPNVYYEIGYAHALDKPLLLIARSGTRVHFDVQGMRILFYENMTKLKDYLVKALAGLVPSPDTKEC